MFLCAVFVHSLAILDPWGCAGCEQGFIRKELSGTEELVSKTRSELRAVLGLGTLFHLTNVAHSFP